MSRVRENRMPGSTGGSWKRSDWSGSPKWDNPTGNRGHQGFWTYRQKHATAPVPDPTQPCTGPSVNRRESCPHGRTATASTGRVEPRPGGGDEPVDVDHPAGAASGRGVSASAVIRLALRKLADAQTPKGVADELLSGSDVQRTPGRKRL